MLFRSGEKKGEQEWRIDRRAERRNYRRIKERRGGKREEEGREKRRKRGSQGTGRRKLLSFRSGIIAHSNTTCSHRQSPETMDFA